MGPYKPAETERGQPGNQDDDHTSGTLSPPNAREHFPKRRQHHQAPPHKEPSTNPPRGTHGRAQDTRHTKEQNRVAKSNVLLAQFHRATRPETVTKHLYSTNDPEELSRIDEQLRRSQRGSREHRRLLKYSNHAHQVAAANSILTQKRKPSTYQSSKSSETETA